MQDELYGGATNANRFPGLKPRTERSSDRARAAGRHAISNIQLRNKIASTGARNTIDCNANTSALYLQVYSNLEERGTRSAASLRFEIQRTYYTYPYVERFDRRITPSLR